MSNAVETLDQPSGSSAASLAVGLLVFFALAATLFLAYAHLAGI